MIVDFDYEVERVHSGTYEHRKLLAAHFSALNGQIQQSIQDRQVGQTYRLVLEPFEGHRELRTLKIVHNEEDFDLPLFHAIE